MGKESDIAPSFTHRTIVNDNYDGFDDDNDDEAEQNVYSLGLPDYTSAPLASHRLSTQICCISLHHSDQIRLINTPKDLIDPIREVILAVWGSIQREKSIYSAYQFKLLGTPWQKYSGSNSVKSRRLILLIMKTMAERGWTLIQAADVSIHQMDLDALFFERMDGGGGGGSEGELRGEESTSISSSSSGQGGRSDIVDTDVEMFALSFHRTDCVRLIEAPPNVVPLVRDTLTRYWPKGIDTDGDFAGSHEFKVNGSLFYAYKEQTIYCRIALCQILVALRNEGYKLYSSVDVTQGQEGRELECWIFRRVGPAWS